MVGVDGAGWRNEPKNEGACCAAPLDSWRIRVHKIVVFVSIAGDYLARAISQYINAGGVMCPPRVHLLLLEGSDLSL
eukprot:SAG11_NODE_12876_length_681_cov_1.871134_1_plen_76_part_01